MSPFSSYVTAYDPDCFLARAFTVAMAPPWILYFALHSTHLAWMTPLCALTVAGRLVQDHANWRALDPRAPRSRFDRAVGLGLLVGVLCVLGAHWFA